MLIIQIHPQAHPTVLCVGQHPVTITLGLVGPPHLSQGISICRITPIENIGRKGNQIQSINFITGLQASELVGTIRLGRSVLKQMTELFGGEIFALTGVISGWGIVIGIGIVSANGKFSRLCRDISITPQTRVACLYSQCGIIALHPGVGSHNIQNTAHTFGIILGTGIGNHFNALDGAGRKTTQYFLRVVAH